MEILIIYNSDGKILGGTTVDENTKPGVQEQITAEGNFTVLHDTMPQIGQKVVEGKVIEETIEVTIAIPADGPSLGVAPSGTCI